MVWLVNSSEAVNIGPCLTSSCSTRTVARRLLVVGRQSRLNQESLLNSSVCEKLLMGEEGMPPVAVPRNEG